MENKEVYSFDLSYIEGISKEKSFINGMVTTFIEEIPSNIEKMENSLKSGDIEEIGAVAHKIKPTISMLNIEKLKPIVLELENLAKNDGSVSEIELLIKEMRLGCNSVVSQLKDKYIK